MARKRMIDPGIWQSEDFSKLSCLAKLVFIGLFSLADDEGRGRANPTYLKSSLFPYDESMGGTDIESALLEISLNMSVIFYSCCGSNYYELLSWGTFQKIDKPTPSVIPRFEEGKDSIRRTFDEPSTNARRAVAPNRIERNRTEKEQEKEENRKGSADDFVSVYALHCSKLPQVKTVTNSRIKAIGNFKKTYTLQDWEEVCKITSTCDFLLRCKR